MCSGNVTFDRTFWSNSFYASVFQKTKNNGHFDKAAMMSAITFVKK